VAVLGLVLYQRVAVARSGSLAIQADRLHYLGDLLTNIGVIVGITLATRFGILIADPIVGLGVCRGADGERLARRSAELTISHGSRIARGRTRTGSRRSVLVTAMSATSTISARALPASRNRAAAYRA